MHKHHLLICVDYFLPHRGGVEVSVSHHITGALQAGYRVTVLTCQHDRTLRHQETIQTPDGDYTIYRVGSGRMSYLRQARSLLHRYLHDHHVDLIHCHTYAAALVGSRARTHYSIPTIVTVHEVFGSLWSQLKPRNNARLYRQIEKYIVTRDYDHIHVPSDYTAQCLTNWYGIDESLITTIHHGIDPSRSTDTIDTAMVQSRRSKLGPDRRLILYYGHAGASKGVQTLLSAMQQHLPSHPDDLWVANITASRGREALIDTITQTLPSGSYHIETGMPLADLQALVMAADVVVVPSLSEGFGFVGAEVSALGKQAIIARGGSLPEVVSGRIAFFDPGDVQALTSLLASTTIPKTTPTKEWKWHDARQKMTDIRKQILENDT